MAPALPPELKDNHPEFSAVTWKDQTIILSYTARAVIKAYCHKDGKWSLKKTRGDEPMFWTGSSATVHNDTMLLMGGLTLGKVSSNDIYALDLHSWRWTKLGPKGNPPLGCHHLTTWMYGGKMYGFGGMASVQYILISCSATMLLTIAGSGPSQGVKFPVRGPPTLPSYAVIQFPYLVDGKMEMQ